MQSYTFKWHLTAPHSTTDFKYYITKQGWNQTAPLTRSALDLTPFLTSRWAAPAAVDPAHTGTLPSRQVRPAHDLAVWTIADTANAFYQCSDVSF